MLESIIVNLFCIFNYAFGQFPGSGRNFGNADFMNSYGNSNPAINYGQARPFDGRDSDFMNSYGNSNPAMNYGQARPFGGREPGFMNRPMGYNSFAGQWAQRPPSYNFNDRVPGPPSVYNDNINAYDFKQKFSAGRINPEPVRIKDTSNNWIPEDRADDPEFSEPYKGSEADVVRDVNELKSRLTATGKWEEFNKMASKAKSKYKGKVLENWRDDARNLAKYSRSLLKFMPGENQKPPSKQNSRISHYDPSPGMSLYWSDDDKPKPITPKPAPRRPLGYMSGQQVMEVALKKIAEFEQAENIGKNIPQQMVNVQRTNQLNTSNAQDIHIQPAEIINLPLFDDFNSPIRWVPLYSNETSDGLAKVTDPKTGKNRNIVVDGTVLVPVIDYNIERLGLTNKPTTTTPASVTTDYSALRTVVKNVDFKNVDERDWLAYEVALGKTKYGEQCEGDGCQSRCQRLGCESSCSGDTCAAGCVGGSCSTYCEGPSCLAMCIGEKCSAKCNGLSCEARCRGKDCEADCRSFSCVRINNGAPSRGGGTFGQHYPQYDHQMMGLGNTYTSY